MRFFLAALLAVAFNLSAYGQQSTEEQLAPASIHNDLLVSARNGDPDAQFLLGEAYFFGEGVAKDDEEALRWYRSAAIQGYADAQLKLSAFYYYGWVVEKDDIEANRLSLLAAEQGNAIAQYNIGFAYYHGIGVASSNAHYAEAVRWWHLAADQGLAPAQYMLGRIYSIGADADYPQALRWWRLAASQWHVQAQYNLGLSYYNGEGVKPDYVTAHMWFSIVESAGGLEIESADQSATLTSAQIRALRADATKRRAYLETLMTVERIEEAQALRQACLQSEFHYCGD